MRRAPGVGAVVLTLGLALAPAGAIPPASSTGPRVLTVLPPGESGFFSVAGEAAGKATGSPAAYGPHIDDQRQMYWGFGYRTGGFEAPSGSPETPAPGVRIYRDAYGVPLIFGSTGYQVWLGSCYAGAQDRLFEMDAIRRIAEGRLAELVGPSAVPADVQARVLGYTAAEYAAQFAALPVAGQQAVEGCVQGVNLWIDQVELDPRLLPAEYVLLSSLPAPWTVRDVLASGVLITRSVASAGGDELDNVAALRELEARYGRAGGRGVFTDLFWQQDTRATTTIPASDATFSNDPTPPGLRTAVFDRMADYADTLPLSLATGAGTGAYPVPASPAAAAYRPPPAVQRAVARAAAAVLAFGRGLHGGSYEYAVAPWRTRAHAALLESAPQLGYSYPSELWELQVSGGGYDARGITVPGLPVVGIGYAPHVAWALTTGLSKTIDSFIETTRPNPVSGGPPQYLHDGTWLDESCRTSTVDYRLAPGGVPAGPALASVAVRVCRTLHGPVVSTDAQAGLARSVQYAMWGRELGTITGILGWDRASNLAQFEASMAQVTWNENTVYADDAGNIAYWHPGLYPLRSPLVDQRFPAPGTGAYDWRGFLPFADMPHLVNPPQGYVANWNSLPAIGWVNGEDEPSAERPAGYASRLHNVTDQLVHAHDLTFADLVAIDRRIGTLDARARDFLPLLESIRTARGLTPAERSALALLAGWDGSSYGPGAGTSADGSTDGPAPTLFAAFMTALRAELFGSLPADLTARDSAVGEHLFDVTPLDNLALRVLEPSTSSLRPSRDYTGGRSAAQVLRAALDQALATLTKQYGTADLATWRRAHPRSPVCSLTGGTIGPCLTMPFEDRGSYIQLVELGRCTPTATGPCRAAAAGPPAPIAAAGGHPSALAFTGGDAALPGAGLAALGTALALVRRRRQSR